MSVQEYYHNGIMKDLLNRGLITPTVYRYMDYFIEVKALEMKGVKTSHAVEQVSDKCRVCEDTVWKAMRKMKG